ncbi:MAG: homoserine dehydrogenase [Candidatus Eremiobacteraeota bacterium]|nr:homoserine dehydrogenase [Candidatus Eremiobacteraeota bacterium]MBV8354809.1 homoserine dehydrogenase [Candidatus Eremiobacteraeota bacterium]
MKPVRIGLLGIGTVGSGTFRVLERNREEITRRAGRRIEIAWVGARNLERARDVVGPTLRVRDDVLTAVTEPDVDIVVEVIGGMTIAKDAVMAAIAHGKHIVTANKALLALHGNEVFEAASRHGVMVAFEGAVSVCIPIIKALREGLTANRIEWIAGIINGTSNYILTAMRAAGLPFDEALADAQRLGYAEADPTFDVEGVDAGHKITLLSAIGFGIPVQFERAYVEGISKLTDKDITYAEQLGYRIKLLGITRRTPQGIELRVHPTLVPAQRLIASVDGAMNAILVKGDAAGVTMYYGAGAGSEPTASAVIADVIDVTRLMEAEPQERVPHLAFQAGALGGEPILAIEDVETSYYLRVRVKDQVGVLADIARTLADSGISIDSMLQKGPGDERNETDIVILTHRTRERNFNEAMAELVRLPTIGPDYARIRCEDLG